MNVIINVYICVCIHIYIYMYVCMYVYALLTSTTMMMFFEKRDSLWWCSLKKEFPQTFGHLKLSFSKSCHFKLKKMTRIYYWLLESKSEKILFTDYCSLITVIVHYSLLLFMVLFTPKFCLFKGGWSLSLGHNSFSRTSFFLEAFFRESSKFFVSTTISIFLNLRDNPP